jgi:hypothetical protein
MKELALALQTLKILPTKIEYEDLQVAQDADNRSHKLKVPEKARKFRQVKLLAAAAPPSKY